jgi:putative nucleotidyltransferase with HDIG domain
VRKKEYISFEQSPDSKKIRRYNKYLSFVLLLILVLGSSLILVYQKSFGQLKINKGDTVGEIIKAPKTVTFKSVSKTEELRKKASSEVPKVYQLDSKVIGEQENKINTILDKINQIRGSSDQIEKKINDLTSIPDLNLSDEKATIILNMSDDDWYRIEQDARNILIDLQKKEKIKYDELGNFKNQIPLKVNQSLSENDKKVVINLSQELLLPNTFLDEVETNKRINQAQEAVAPVYYTIERDQIILKPGDEVNDLDLEKLEALGLTSVSFLGYKFLGILFLIIILSLLSFIYIRYFVKSKIPFNKIFSIFIIFLLIVIFLARLVLPIRPVIAYLFPVAVPVLLLAILIDFDLGIFSALIFSIFFGLAAGESFELIVVQSITILTGLLVVKNIRKSNVFIKLVLFIGIVNFLAALSFNLIVGNFSLRTIFALLASGLICGLVSAVLVAGLMVFIGNILGVASFLQLSDLANPDQPLLKELSLTAPGTYHHSILVGNLAEAGAKSISANPLMARLGAYYHDVGKIERPLFFVENQEQFLNVHEKMDPQKSATYIINHVSDGLKIANKYHLPAEIKNIIAEHHGTTCVQFFYDLANKKGIKINKKDFCYPGPIPRTKESAIIMLADSIEASTRSLKKFTPASVKHKIEEIIKQRFEEGQLDRSLLTTSDLNKLKIAFIETASAVFHQRVSYHDSE